MATVYLAQDLKHDRPVALKVLRPELAAVIGAQRFLAEIKVTANLQHPHIVTLIDSGESDGILWYVLPYIRGESLRDRLTRERQLGVDETLAITRQIAGALDYAHAQGVIHRDIKPENILLHEGEAMLADFGIALAVREAGGNRLTETGLSLGTPQYMSPEQATADRTLDARSDVYSLGAVVYEMLAGEPPHTGATAHAVIAKLLTERPVSLQVVRSTLPSGVDAAVSRALEKVAADRFPTAGEFARTLEAARGAAPLPSAIGTGVRATSLRRRALVFGVPVGLVVLAAAGWLVWRGHPRASAPSFSRRTQVTFTGNATRPALSADGTQIAYVVHECTASGCQDGIEIQDVDGAAKRRLVDGLSAMDYINWSPDRRFLIFWARLGQSSGTFLVPTLGGRPRLLGSGVYGFLWSGDSLVAIDGNRVDTVGWLKTEPVEGEARDSIRVHGLSAGYPMAFPGDRWLLLGGQGPGGPEARVIDRQGRQSDVFRSEMLPQVGGDAAWFPVPLGETRQGIVRLPVDLQRGRFRPPPDTVLDAASGIFDVSADGGTIAYVEGGRQYDLWVLPLTEALQGRFLPERHVFGSTSQLGGGLAPDGRHVLVEHSEAGPEGSRVVESVLPATGEAGADFNSPGRGAGWTEDGMWIQRALRSATGTQFVTIDPRTGRQERIFAIADTGVSGYDPLPAGGWVWVPASSDRVRLQRKEGDKAQDFPLPSGEPVFNVNVSPDETRLVTMGSTPSGDTATLNVISLPGGKVTRWATILGNHIYANWLGDGSIMAWVKALGGSLAMYRVTAPGHVQRLGIIPRAIWVTWSRDGSHVAVATTEVHGDVWLARSSPRGP